VSEPRLQKTTVQGPELYPKQYHALFRDADFGWIEGATKSGKAQPLSATVYTPTGPKPMSDITVNSKVLTPGGGVATVIGEYPQGKQDIYEVTFSDGSTVRATGDHWWSVSSYRHNSVERLYTTRQLAEMSTEKMWVPPQGVANFHAQEVPIDPYAVGLLLAEGSFRHRRLQVSNGDDHCMDRLRDALPDGMELTDQVGDNVDGGIVDRDHRTNRWKTTIGLWGMWGVYSDEKFIPDKYKYNDPQVRWNVLRGVMDGDGWVNENGHARLGQTSKRLADDVREVVESLGGEARILTKDGGEHKDVYRMSIKYPDPSRLFSLPRKKEECQPMKRKVRRKFRTIEKVGQEEAKCIKIDDDRSLYLTDHFIPTHNTIACVVWLAKHAIEADEYHQFAWVAPYSNQAEMAFDRMKQMLPDDIWTDHKNKLYIQIEDGGRVWFKSGDEPNTIYGQEYHAIVVDEGSRVKEESWQAVRSTREATRGPVRVAGNVTDRNNWFYRQCRMAETGEGPEDSYYVKLTAQDAIDAGVIDPRTIEEARYNYKKAGKLQEFMALYFCEPPDDGGNPFGMEAIRRCQVEEFSPRPPICWAWDLARSTNYTVGTPLDNRGRVCDGFTRFQRPWPETKREIVRRSGQLPTIVDSTGVGDPMFEFLQETDMNVMGFSFQTASKQQLMERLRAAIQQGDISFPKNSQIVHELKQFTYSTGRNKIKYQAADGAHDDCVDSLALGVYLWEQQRKMQNLQGEGTVRTTPNHLANPFQD